VKRGETPAAAAAAAATSSLKDSSLYIVEDSASVVNGR
jgi:hypothetical protein